MRPRSRAFTAAAVSVVAAASLVVRIGAAQADPREALVLPRHGEARPPGVAATRGDEVLDPLCGELLAGTIVLDRDVSCGLGSNDGITLLSGATLDLGGFTYEGFLESSGSGVTLRNGTLANVFIDFYACTDCLIEEVHVRDSVGFDGFVVGLGERNLVRASRFTGNRTALDLYDYWGFSNGDNTVVSCEFEDNTIAVNIASHSGNLVTSNVFRGNRIGVNLWDEDYFGVSDNTISDNEFAGNRSGVAHRLLGCQYTLDRCQQGNLFTGNAFVGNENSGLLVAADLGECAASDARCDEAELAIEGNRFETNGFGPPPPPGSVYPASNDGLFVSAPPDVADGIAVAGNVAIANADLGIEAAGVQDGGGNRARANGHPLQCVGVVCERIVDVDVWPGRRRVRIHPDHGWIPVAVLGAGDFDVRDVAVQRLAIGPAGASPERFPWLRRRDLNRDGFEDLLVVVRARRTGIDFGDTELCVSGETTNGIPFGGCDEIATAKPRPDKKWHGWDD